MKIADLYTNWINAETAAQLGVGKVAGATAAKKAYSEAAKALVKRLVFKTGVAVRWTADGRYDVAEHVTAAEDVASPAADGGGLKRAKGEALCQKTLVVDTDLVAVKRRAPSCARCLAVVEALVGETQ